MWSPLTVECYSASKSEGILTHARTWVGLEDTVLSEASQSQKDKYRTIPFTEYTWNSQSHRDGVEWSRGHREWGYCFGA